MTRYRELDRDELNEAQRRVWDEVVAGPRHAVPPPAHVWLNSPGLADHAHKLGAHVRFGTDFSPRLTEIAILVTARYWTAQFEWQAHARLARQAGLAEEVIAAIAVRQRLPTPTSSSCMISVALSTAITALMTACSRGSSSALASAGWST